MTEQQCMKYLVQMLLGLKEIHKMEKFHKNICASHFLLRKNENTGNVLKLASYGSERDFYEHKSRNWRGDLEDKSWPHNGGYLAPEFLAGSRYDQKAEVWSIGILLF